MYANQISYKPTGQAISFLAMYEIIMWPVYQTCPVSHAFGAQLTHWGFISHSLSCARPFISHEFVPL